MSRLFESVESSPPVEVFALAAAFNDDTDSHKVNLGIGGNYDFTFTMIPLSVNDCVLYVMCFIRYI